MITKWFKNSGPATLVAAAFIGPGTVTVCTIAGVSFGFTLLWALLLSIAATIILQEMAARVGVVSQKGLSEVIKQELKNPILKSTILFLILVAIVVGNAAYEAGNISGAILGVESIFGDQNWMIGPFYVNMYSILIGVIAFALLYVGNYKFIEKILVFLVILMSVSFLITAIITKPNILGIFKGALLPNLSEDNILTIIALVGTTVVPYNLFLHAALVKEKWKVKESLPNVQRDTIVSIGLGGVVSMAIIISAAAIPNSAVNNAADLAKSLTPIYGNFASYFLSIGLFAAGITSAITAPLAAAYVAKGIFNFKGSLKSNMFRSIWMLILLLGIIFSSIGIKPIEIIKFAQVANALLLPIIVAILLWIVNKKSVLQKFVNTKIQNILGVLVFVISVFLGVKGILKVFEIL